MFKDAYKITADIRRRNKPVCVVCSNDKQALKIEEALQILVGKEKKIAYLPSPQTLFYENVEPSPNIVARRLKTLFLWQIKELDAIVMSVNTYIRAMPEPNYLLKSCLAFQVGNAIDPVALRSNFIDWGYEFADFVCDPGTFAIRGSIVDIFPFSAEHAYRIELFDNNIESIYCIKGEELTKVGEISVFPAREYSLTPEIIENFQINWQKKFGLWGQKSEVYLRMSKGKIYAGIYDWLPWLYNHKCFWKDYNADARTYFEPGCFTSYLELQALAQKAHKANNSFEPMLPIEQLFHSAIDFKDDWPKSDLSKDYTATLKIFSSMHEAESHAHKNSGTVIDCHGSLYDWLKIPKKGYYTIHSNLQVNEVVNGILLETVVYESNKKPQKQVVQKLNTKVNIGSYVVHKKYGIGYLSKIDLIEHAGQKYDCLVIEYADQGKVLIPTTELDQISRFKSIAGENIQLSKLGTKSWRNKQAKIISSIQDDAVMLMQMHASRKQQRRLAYKFDEVGFNDFRSRFPFEDTNDQAHITNQIIQDLTDKDYPMDRLVCGDVGFGKTEIALRACWLVVRSGKQVIWLAPTTVLAQQHITRLQERFYEDCFNITECVGSKKLTKEDQADLSLGKIDILVGTHGVLNKNLEFKQLGLIVIDEEHKFGVKQKDAILLRYPAVDILSLSATPIPRSLNMAMSSLRDISLLATAPAERLDVKTIIGQTDNEELMQQAILRETQRGGQVYFCYNRVERLPEMATRIKSWFPNIEVAIVHGQMPRSEIEISMQNFATKKTDILLCSSIVESGIDYANANTLIVYRADLFGLSQLHQLRGRVGRGKQQAYAYLMVPDSEYQSKECQNRIRAIEQNSKLGSGFALAVEDLEIRGAGNLLGKKQSGHILDIGFQYYIQLLNQTMQALESGSNKIFDVDDLLSNKDFGYSVPFSILIEDDYIHDPNERLKCYQELAECCSHTEIGRVSNNWLKKYGCMPEATMNLINMAHIKLDLTIAGARHLDIEDYSLCISFHDAALTEAQILKIASMPHKYILQPPSKVVINGAKDYRMLISEFTSYISS